MKTSLSIAIALGLFAGCASKPVVSESPPMRPGGPNWAEVDKSVQRIKERESNKSRLVETSRVADQGFKSMTDDEYADVLAGAREEIKKRKPDLPSSDLEKEARAFADEERRQSELDYTTSASSTYEWKAP